MSDECKLLKLFGYSKWVPRKIMVPMIFYKKIYILYETFFKSATSITNFISFMFQFSVGIFWDLYENYGVKSFGEFLIVKKYLEESLPVLIENKYLEKTMITLEDVLSCRKYLNRLSDDELIEFLEYVKDHKLILMGGQLIMSRLTLLSLYKDYKFSKLKDEHISSRG